MSVTIKIKTQKYNIYAGTDKVHYQTVKITSAITKFIHLYFYLFRPSKCTREIDQFHQIFKSAEHFVIKRFFVGKIAPK